MLSSTAFLKILLPLLLSTSNLAVQSEPQQQQPISKPYLPMPSLPYTAPSSNNANTDLGKLKQQNRIVPNIFSRLGESVLLECGAQEHALLRQLESSVSSMPVLVNWYKHYSLTRRNDKPIYAKYLANNIDYEPHVSRDYENRLQVVDKLNLNISNLKAVDEALYECRLILFDKAYAESQTGYMAYLQVHVAPEFEFPNEEIVYFKPNVPMRLYCYAKGKPTPTITWYRNGLRLEANTSVLQETFPSSSSYEDSVEDMFEYKCRAENIVGSIEHTVKVIRSGSLFFTESLKNLTVTEGTILNWPCLAQSNTEITYKWFKDSVAVQSHLHKWSERGALFQDGMLYLLETYRNDSGWYECHAYTTDKRIETTAYLNVLYGPDIAPFPSPYFVVENSNSILIDCVIKSNPSVIALEWFKDKYLLSNTHKYQILPNNSLMIKNVQKSDMGQYYCTCNNTLRKVVSSVVKLEVVDSKKLDITTIFTSTSQNSTKLACKTLATAGLDERQLRQLDLSAVDFSWFKLNSKLPKNRALIDSEGALTISNLRMGDSGVYFCKLNDDSGKFQLVANDPIRGLISGLTEKMIKLIVVQNKSTEISFYSDQNTSELSKEEIIELPHCPTNIKINQTSNGILIAWSYPKQTPVRIEYFQIYFRELLNDVKHTGSQQQNSHSNEWKTTESIGAIHSSYLIHETDLNENHLYEFQLVSFSAYSKSLPSQIIKSRYLPKISRLSKKPNTDSSFSPTSQPFYPNLFYNYLLNISQLDVILIAIFCLLILILIICITAFIIYKRSYRNLKTKGNSKQADIDEWGFQSSSAATATFLSSHASSEKSINNKLSPALDSAINSKAQRISSNSSNNDESSDFNNDAHINTSYNALIHPHNQYHSYTLNRNNTLIRNNGGGILNLSKTNTLPPIYRSVCVNENNQSKVKESNHYYYTAKKSQTLNTNTKIDSNSNSSTTSNSNANNANNNSSGVASANSTVLSSEEINSNNDESPVDSKRVLLSPQTAAINKIKYNAKTNILQQQESRNLKSISQQQHQSPNKRIQSNLISQVNNKNSLRKHMINDYKRIANEEEDDDDEEEGFEDCGYNSNEFSLLNSSLAAKEPSPPLFIEELKDQKRKITHCYNWLNKQVVLSTASAAPTTIISIDDHDAASSLVSHPIQSSNSLNYTSSSNNTSPNSKQTQQQHDENGERSNNEDEFEEEKTPLPFPTSHFNLKTDLNSCSSLTVVSKLPGYSLVPLNETGDLKNKLSMVYSEDRSMSLTNDTKNSFSTTSSTSSGCSSLENNFNKLNNCPLSWSAVDAANNKQQPIVEFSSKQNNKQLQSYSYRPILKTNNESSGNKSNNTSTFRPSKIDFV